MDELTPALTRENVEAGMYFTHPSFHPYADYLLGWEVEPGCFAYWRPGEAQPRRFASWNALWAALGPLAGSADWTPLAT
jgi:hypothetical protein